MASASPYTHDPFSCISCESAFAGASPLDPEHALRCVQDQGQQLSEIMAELGSSAAFGGAHPEDAMAVAAQHSPEIWTADARLRADENALYAWLRVHRWDASPHSDYVPHDDDLPF